MKSRILAPLGVTGLVTVVECANCIDAIVHGESW